MKQQVIETTKRLVPSDYLSFLEDFVADDSASRFTVTGSGTVALLADQLGGVLQIDTETGADQDTSISTGEQILAPAKNPFVEARVRVDNTLGFGTAIYKLAIRKDADEAAQISIDASGNVKVFADGGSAAVVNNVDTGEDVVKGTWYRLGIQVIDNGAVVFYLDGVEVYRTVKNVMVTTATPEYDVFVEVEDTSAAQHKLDVDYVYVTQER